MQRIDIVCAQSNDDKEERRRNDIACPCPCTHHHKHHRQWANERLCVQRRTNKQTDEDAVLSSFFIKCHHGCPILIVFICWWMFVNVISFNFSGTFFSRFVFHDRRRPWYVYSLASRCVCVCSALLPFENPHSAIQLWKKTARPGLLFGKHVFIDKTLHQQQRQWQE